LPQFDEHIQQAKHNLQFLELVNQSGTAFCDWQVTICFYTAVHLVNAHLSLLNMQYRKHVDVKDALNPKNQYSVGTGAALPENEYLAYTKLQSLSRRSRYLVNEKDGNLAAQQAFLTYDVHLNKSLKHLNSIIKYFTGKYNFTTPVIKISCAGINKGDLSFVD
jgi:hypothetical protein